MVFPPDSTCQDSCDVRHIRVSTTGCPASPTHRFSLDEALAGYLRQVLAMVCDTTTFPARVLRALIAHRQDATRSTTVRKIGSWAEIGKAPSVCNPNHLAHRGLEQRATTHLPFLAHSQKIKPNLFPRGRVEEKVRLSGYFVPGRVFRLADDWSGAASDGMERKASDSIPQRSPAVRSLVRPPRLEFT